MLSKQAHISFINIDYIKGISVKTNLGTNIHTIAKYVDKTLNMVKKQTRIILLISLLSFAFVYRLSLLIMNGFPPGADIGLHESVIKSITQGQTNFFYNYYHMGGGFSATNPGFHIFTAFIISMTGLTDYLAQAVVASFFSAFLILCAFLLVRQVWNELAGLVVAVLVTFSFSDILIISWAGYPNIVTLMLIPALFYLFLKSSRMSSKSYLSVASIMVSAIFLTHIFSAFVFVAITGFALFVGSIFYKRTGLTKKQAVSWLLPIVIGALLVSPYLFNMVPVYF